jgi:hypothetical protein
MLTWAVGVCLVIAWVAAVCDLSSYAASRLTLRLAFVTVAVSGVVALLASRAVFYGLEYEDAYEYMASARLAIEKPPTGLFNEVCLARSNPSQCDVQGATTHPIGYTSLIALASRAVGSPAAAGRLISCLAAISLALVILSHALASGRLNALTSWIVALTGGPMATVLLFTTLSEPQATLFLTASFACLERATRTGVTRTHWIGALCVLCAGLVRREHALAAALFACVAIRRRFSAEENRPTWPGVAAWGVAAGALVGLGISGPVDGSFAGHSAFSPVYALNGVPAFLESFMSFDRFASMGVAIVVLAVTARTLPLSRYTLLLAGAYLALFSCFAQSFWVLSGEAIPPLHADRYLVQLSGVVAIGTNAAFHDALRGSLGARMKVYRSLLAALALAALARGLVLRHRWASIENNVRTRVVLAACGAIRPPSVVILNESLIAEALCPDAATVNFGVIGEKPVAALSRQLAHAGYLYYLPASEDSASGRQRWKASVAFMSSLHWTTAWGEGPHDPTRLLRAMR